MKSLDILNAYSRGKAWIKVVDQFRSASGISTSAVKDEDVDVEGLIGNLTGLDMAKSLSLASLHKTASTHLAAALQEAGIEEGLLSKKKVQLLSFILNTLGFPKFDKVIDEVVHEGKFLNLKDALTASDSDFTNLVFSVLKTIFPPLGALEFILKNALTKL